MEATVAMAATVVMAAMVADMALTVVVMAAMEATAAMVVNMDTTPISHISTSNITNLTMVVIKHTNPNKPTTRTTKLIHQRPPLRNR